MTKKSPTKKSPKKEEVVFRPVVGVLMERTMAHADKVFFNLLGIAQQGWPFIRMNYGRTDLVRNKMAEHLLKSNFSHLIMLDIDHVHPMDIVQRLMHDKNGVVDHHTDQDDETQHGQYIQRLVTDEPVDQEETHESTGGSQWHTEHNHKGIKEASKKGGHQ